MSPDERMQAVAARIEALVADFATSPDPAVGRRAQELVRLLMELYGAGLDRILRILEREHGRGGAATGALLEDELVASLLVLHDLHPHDREARVRRELERVRQVAGADVALLALGDATARVQVRASGHGRARSAPELRRLIEEVVRAAAPEVARVEVEGLADTASPALVQLTRTRPAEPKDRVTVR